MNNSKTNMDIAIIGLSCRFPGAASIAEYWDNLCNGVESITFFDDQELLDAGVSPDLLANPNYVKAAPLLSNIEMFDAAFFGYSPKDASMMDPQQRLFLETCWEAFEDAGYEPLGYPGKVGVLSTGGGGVTSYLLDKLDHADLPGQTASISHINNDKDFLSTRVSFKLNLTGPSFTIQSACSSSLVAVHYACQHLRFNECDMMLVGGSVIRVPQVEGYLAEKRSLHSLDGHCRPFDGEGHGTIFGSGVGAALIKPLDQAIADRDHIYAVIKGTAVNNDGSGKSSYTAPSLGSQSQAAVDALQLAGVTADSVGYIECHSTGTTVGDPLEIKALTNAFRHDTERQQFCAVGSVKANIGHPEQSAGIAGLIKAALVLHHKRIPPSINFNTPNPEIDFASSPFYVNDKLSDFASTGTPRRAGLNSLGIGGTNAFTLLEEAPPTPPQTDQSSELSPRLVTLSAKSADALVARVEQLLNWLSDHPDAVIEDVCYTTNVSKSQFPFRFAATASSIPELQKQLTKWRQTTGADKSKLQRTTESQIAFLFSGQGTQYPGMAAELYRTQPTFRDAMDRCHALVMPHLGQGLLNVIFGETTDPALVNRTDYTQPALFAVEYALAQLLKSWSIVPSAVIGHSLGEITAACIADVMPLEYAMRLVTTRGALVQSLTSNGAMASVFAEEAVVRDLIDQFAPEISIAAMNGPQNTAVSGDQTALKRLLQEFDQRNITYRELQVSTGFHSALTDPILDGMERIAGEFKYRTPSLPLISNVTGQVMPGAPDKTYWRRHLREAVRFTDGILAMENLECKTYIEIGPHPVLLAMAQASLGTRGKSATWVATLNRLKSNTDSITEMLSALYLAGHSIDWQAVHAPFVRRRISLPTYPFQRKRHWIGENASYKGPNSPASATHQPTPIVQRSQNPPAAPHYTNQPPSIVETPTEPITATSNAPAPLPDTPERPDKNNSIYETRYSIQNINWLPDHKIAGTVVLPTTAALEAATIAGRAHFTSNQISLDNALHHQAMPVAAGEEHIVQVKITPSKTGTARFELTSANVNNPEQRRTHMTGTLCNASPPSWPQLPVHEIQARCSQTLSVDDLYGSLKTEAAIKVTSPFLFRDTAATRITLQKVGPTRPCAALKRMAHG